MKNTLLLKSSLVLLLGVAACGRPPTGGGGGPPKGDFPVSVVGAPVTVAPLSVSVDLVGSFSAQERVDISARTQGEIVEMPNREGERVKVGDVLLSLKATKVEARLTEARARLDLAASTFRRTESLRASNNSNEQALDEARAQAEQSRAALALLEEELSDMTLTAPMDGVLGLRRVSVGQVVQPGQVVMELVQTDPLDFRFEVPERHVGRLKTGMTARVSVESRPGEVFEGDIVYVDPTVSESTRTLLVKASVPNTKGQLRPGMFGRVSLVMEEIPGAMFVPESAVMQRGEKNLVVLRNSGGRAEMREVEVGVREAGRVHIRKGLAAEDLVVAEGLIKAWPGTLLDFSDDSRRYGLEPSKAPVPAALEPKPEG